MKSSQSMKNLKHKTVYLKFKAEMIQGENGVVISTDKKNLLGSIVVHGKSYKEAENNFWEMAAFIHKHHEQRSLELNRWKWFQKGDWGKPGGNWFIVFGINVYFRYGNTPLNRISIRGGWFIPFTNLNIMINNYWMKVSKA